ncbi:Pcmt1-prov protein [Sistotremastrum niveocremeum HHB9708]|uniref:protein-L-isoaspartate(D-aspartate) O-methyltransferase n=2 Tax=Sistotremastraceae TaxID=3402574 RepID=A0A164XQZ8_9AGAM|nr:Pcmt1-prov protein [Sistotremastrum niveocremeum HHB9708]KZT35378.1 protein-L-isoaspartate O-methyltransferase [Sistotremastrum suecicum HHB10207 ss-3]
MAWRCSGRTNEELIQNLFNNGLITSTRVMTAMKHVDRKNYVRSRSTGTAYEDSPQSIDYGATISAPHMHAHAAENLLPLLKPGARVLDIGSGSGYTAAIFYHLIADPRLPVHDRGVVVGIDHISELVEWSKENLVKDGLEGPLQRGEIQMIAADGRLGHAAGGPYAAIHVGAAAPIIPEVLIEQLASPGRMFIPVGTDAQEIIQVDKDEKGVVSRKTLFGVQYVPLTDKSAQWR